METTHILSKIGPVAANDPSRSGSLASRKVLFGESSRYALYAIHTRFDAVEWFVADAGAVDAYAVTPAIIRQEATAASAIRSVLLRDKIERCDRVAREQLRLTMAEAAKRGAGWTHEDFEILMPMNLADRHCWNKYAMRGNDYAAHRNYRCNLNA